MPVLGVDGCPGGWVGALVHRDSLRWLLLGCMAEVLQVPAAGVGIDIPIGLPDAGPRACDVAARRLLGRRGSSVFPAPVRAVLGAGSYPEACERSRAAQGRALSLQTYHLLGRIADVDAELAPAGQERVAEVHPEVSFAGLLGRVPAPKKTPAGRAERTAALQGVMPALDVAALVAVAPRPARPDDALDALACAWSAERRHRGVAVSLPSHEPSRDGRGLAMTITW